VLNVDKTDEKFAAAQRQTDSQHAILPTRMSLDYAKALN
jgi:hypothetical protein